MDSKKMVAVIYSIILIAIFALIIWGIIKLIRWIKKTIEKQQEISMIKAQAMKTAAENISGQTTEQPQEPRHYMSQAEYDQYKREHGIK